MSMKNQFEWHLLPVRKISEKQWLRLSEDKNGKDVGLLEDLTKIYDEIKL